MGATANIIYTLVYGVAVALALRAFSTFYVSSEADLAAAVSEKEVSGPNATRRITSIHGVDDFVGTVAVFFRDLVLLSPIQWSFLDVAFGALLAPCVWTSIEFDRQGMWLVPLYFTLYQFGGVSVFFPLVLIYYTWVSSSLLSKGQRPVGLTRIRVILSLIQLFPVMGIHLVLRYFKKDSTVFFYSLVAWLVWPCVVPLIAMLFKSASHATSLETKRAKSSFRFVLAACGGISFSLYALAIGNTLSVYGLNGFQDGTVISHLVSTVAQRTLLWDILIFVAATIVHIYRESGVVAVLAIVLASPIVSPGFALAMYYYHLEGGLHKKRPVNIVSPKRKQK